VSDHPSGTHVAARLMRPKPGSLGRATLKRSPIWSCTGRGLPSRPVTRTAGELLPHRFTLTRTPRKGPLAVYFLLRFPSGFPGWPLTSALLCGVRTFLDGEPCELRGASRRDPTAATWLAPRVYHRSPDVRLLRPGMVHSAHDQDEDRGDDAHAADPRRGPRHRVPAPAGTLVGCSEARRRKDRRYPW